MKSKIIAIRIEQSEFKQIEILRQKHFINVSEFFRKSLRDLYNKMEHKNK